VINLPQCHIHLRQDALISNSDLHASRKWWRGLLGIGKCGRANEAGYGVQAHSTCKGKVEENG
jgi:hypothetical protein